MKTVAPLIESGSAERRAFALTGVEFREAPKGSKSPGGFRGYAAVYDSLSLNLGGFREKIDVGAFDAAIAEDDVRALVNHDRNLLLARSKAGEGTLSLSSDKRGLLTDIPELPDTSYARDLVESMKRGDLDQMSFGFTVVRDRWEEDEDGRIIRTLEEVRLFDVSPVTFPAYPETSAEARSIVISLPEEIRAGKVLSSRSRTLVEQARDALAELLVHADGEENEAPADDAETRDAENPAAVDVKIALAKARIRAMALGEDPRDVVV